MSKHLEKLCIFFALCFIGVASAGATAFWPAECPRDIQCLDVWDPVICDDGQVYSNDCYAYRACATGCVPFYASQVAASKLATTASMLEIDCPYPPPPGCIWRPGSNCRILDCIG
jgi:hypothetical protein